MRAAAASVLVLLSALAWPLAPAAAPAARPRAKAKETPKAPARPAPGPLFQESAPSQVRLEREGPRRQGPLLTRLTNVTYEEASVEYRGQRVRALVRKTVSAEQPWGQEEGGRARISAAFFLSPLQSRPADFTLEAEAAALHLRGRYYEVVQPPRTGLPGQVTLHELTTRQRLLSSTGPYLRVELPDSPLTVFLGYSVEPGAERHGRLTLASWEGPLSEVSLLPMGEDVARDMGGVPQLRLVQGGQHTLRRDAVGEVLTLGREAAGGGLKAVGGFSLELDFGRGLVVSVPVAAGRLVAERSSTAEIEVLEAPSGGAAPH